MKYLKCKLTFHETIQMSTAWRIVLVASSAQHVKKPFILFRNPG